MALKFNWLREICTNERQQLLQVYWAFMLWWQQTQTFHAPRGKDVSTGELVHTIYMGKPEITVGKSNGLCHSIWSASENSHGLWFEVMQCSLFSWFGYTHVLCGSRSSTMSNLFVFVHVQDFHPPSGLCQW